MILLNCDKLLTLVLCELCARACLPTGNAFSNTLYFSLVVHPLQFSKECLLFSSSDNFFHVLMENSSNTLFLVSLWHLPITLIFSIIFGKFLRCVSGKTAKFSIHSSNMQFHVSYLEMRSSNGTITEINSYLSKAAGCWMHNANLLIYDLPGFRCSVKKWTTDKKIDCVLNRKYRLILHLTFFCSFKKCSIDKNLIVIARCSYWLILIMSRFLNALKTTGIDLYRYNAIQVCEQEMTHDIQSNQNPGINRKIIH